PTSSRRCRGRGPGHYRYDRGGGNGVLALLAQGPGYPMGAELGWGAAGLRAAVSRVDGQGHLGGAVYLAAPRGGAPRGGEARPAPTGTPAGVGLTPRLTTGAVTRGVTAPSTVRRPRVSRPV